MLKRFNKSIPIRRHWPKLAIVGGCLLLMLVLLWGPEPTTEPESSILESDPEAYLFPSGGPLIKVLAEDGNVMEIGLEEFLVGVLAAEMPATFEPAALEAQTIAARTYIYSHLEPYGAPRHANATICTDSTHCQAYANEQTLRQRWGNNFATYYDAVCRAVATTKGMVIFYDDQPIEALYCSTCGGRTEAVVDVWGRELPYLQSVECRWDSHAPRYSAAQVLTLAAVADALQVSEASLKAMSADYTAGGAIAQLTVDGKQLSGSELRQALGLNSANVSWLIDGERILISTIGYGHGVGLCQYGADGMAQQGYTAIEILQYYYQGINIQNL